MPSDIEIIKGQLRDLNRQVGEIQLAQRIDTPWRKLEDHLTYGIQTLQRIPLATRFLLVIGFIVVTVGVVMKNLKVIAAGADIVMLSIVAVGE